jgi:peptide/nickel transport system permease protein
VTIFLLRRLALAIPLLWVVSTLVFLLVHLIPGDPVDFMIGENAALEQREELRRAYHLDKPLIFNPGAWSESARSGRSLPARVTALFTDTQYSRFLGDLAGGRLHSLHTKKPVVETLQTRFLHTLALAAAALLVAVCVSIPVGTLSAWRQYSWIDTASMVGALVGISMPNFWLGPLLILLFSVDLGWFPVSGADSPRSLVLPALTLGLGMSAILTRITRAAVLDTIREDFVRTARAKGLPEWKVVTRHALRAALIPVVTVLGLQFGALLAGSIVTEEVFGWPGLGREVVGAIRARDFPMVQGCVLLVAGSYVVVNTATDLLYAVINPRVRLS